MNEAMVAPTQEAGIPELGLAAICPVDEVMSVAPVGRTVATRKSAVLVADDERAPERRWNGSGAAADIDRLGVGSEQHPGHGAVAGDAAHGVRGDWLRPLELTRGTSRLFHQCGHRCGDREVRLLAADL